MTVVGNTLVADIGAVVDIVTGVDIGVAADIAAVADIEAVAGDTGAVADIVIGVDIGVAVDIKAVALNPDRIVGILGLVVFDLVLEVPDWTLPSVEHRKNCKMKRNQVFDYRIVNKIS